MNLSEAQNQLNHHPLFAQITNVKRLRFFMESHVFAVWDFMSLLKRLQREITCVEVPWRPSPYPDSLVRFINQIVVGEESDVDEVGQPTSHFKLYLAAMEEVGANTAPIREFLATLDAGFIPEHARAFTEFTLQTAQEAELVQVASAFFYGREKLIPGMFESIVSILKAEGLNCPKLMYYLERHIHVDGEEHGPLSEQCLDILCDGRAELKEMSQQYGLMALSQRQGLWDRTLLCLNADRSL